MTLRIRLLLGYGYLIALHLLTAVSSAAGFYHLSKGIDRVLKENFESIDAAMGMQEALERQESAVLVIMLEPAVGSDALALADAAFDRELARARGNVTQKREGDILDLLQQSYTAYRAARNQYLLEHPEEAAYGQYRDRTAGLFQGVKNQVFSLMELNQQGMLDADHRARRTAMQNSVMLGVMVVVAMLSLLVLLRRFQEGFLLRLHDLRDTTEAIARGESKRRLPQFGSDELGLIAKRLNETLDAHSRTVNELQGMINQSKELLLGTLSGLKEKVALFGLDGAVHATNLPPKEEKDLLDVSQWIEKKGKPILKDVRKGNKMVPASVRCGETQAEVQLLLAGEHRPVGWLARLD